MELAAVALFLLLAVCFVLLCGMKAVQMLKQLRRDRAAMAIAFDSKVADLSDREREGNAATTGTSR